MFVRSSATWSALSLASLVRVGACVALPLGGCGAAPADDDATSPDAYAFDLLVETEALDLGDVCVGLSGEPVELSIANPTGAASPPIRASLTGPGAASFTIVSSTCEEGLAPRAFCAVQLVLTPMEAAALIASLELEAGEWSFAVALTGRAVECDGLTIGPSPHNFGSLAIGETSSRATFTVENSGDRVSGVLRASISGPDASQFALVPGLGDGCSRRALGPGASCTIDVIFAPTTAGSFAGNLNVEETSLGVSSVALFGTGVPAAP